MLEVTVTVLLIEDNPGDARLIREMLIHEQDPPYRIRHAETLTEGIEQVLAGGCDVVLLDLTLPDSTGIDTLAALRAAAPDMPVVVLTGFNERALGIEALQLGAQDYLVKGDTPGPTLQRVLRYAIERKRIEAAEHEHLETIEALRDSLAALTSTLDLDEVLDRVLDNIGRVIPHVAATITLVEEGRGRMVRARSNGQTDAFFSGAFALTDNPLLVEVVRTGIPHSHGPLPKVPGRTDDKGGWVLLIPIELEELVIGVITIFRRTPFSARDEERMRLFAGQAAIALRNARQYWNTSALAALQERQRLARDLHDSVTSTLFSASVIAETLARSWANHPENVERLATQLHQLNTSALAEMRVLLLELRPKALESVPLQVLLEQLVQSTRSRKAIKITLQVDEHPGLPLPIKEGLYRITQEAMNNVIKHSRATCVSIRLAVQDDGRSIDLVINDDGIGFDMVDRKPASLGLTIMSERAETMGGKLIVVSEAGSGVTIRVHIAIPIQQGQTS